MAAQSKPSADAGSDIPRSPLRVLDLFSGIGGFSLGLERAGFETTAFCEISPKCRHLLNHHWPEVPTYGDICQLSADQLRADGITVDAICGGFPCQDISFAGKGAGLAGERSGLWREYGRLVRELRPSLVFVENVAALLGRGLGDVLGDLAALGYDAWWDCIPASAVGAPHRRDRLWLVAYPGSLEHQGYGDALRWAIAAELSRADLGDAYCTPAHAHAPESGPRRAVGEPGWWLSEPDVGRVAHGVPARVERLHGLGNAVIPEIPYRLGRAALTAFSEIRVAA